MRRGEGRVREETRISSGLISETVSSGSGLEVDRAGLTAQAFPPSPLSSPGSAKSEQQC